MAITEPSQFTLQKKKQSYKPVVFVNFDAPGEYWASKFIDVSEDVASSANWSDGAGADYAGLLAPDSIGGISQSVNRFGGLATLGGTTISLTNMGYAAFLDDYPYTEGEELTIYLVFDDGTPLVFAEALPVLTGLVEKYNITPERITVTISPPEILGELEFTNHADNPAVPFSYDGVKFPIVYGDHSRYMNRLLDASETELQAAHNMPEAQLLGVAPDEDTLLEIYYAVSNEALYEFSDEDIWIEDPTTGRLWNIDPSQPGVTISRVSSTTAPTVMVITIDTGTPLTVHDYVFATDVITPTGVPAYSPYTNKERAGDQNNGSFAYLYTSTGAGSWSYRMNIRFSEIQYGDNVTLPSQYQVYSRTRSLEATTSNIFTAAGTQSISGYASTRYYNSGYTNSLSDSVGVGVAGSGATDIEDIIYEVFKRVDLTLDFNPDDYKVYVACKGNKDDASGTYTGSAGSLIENPVHMLHHLVRNYFGKSASELDSSITSPTSTAAAQRASWDFSALYTEEASYKSTVDRFAKDGLLFAFIDNLNKLKVRAIRSAATEVYPVSGTTTPSDADKATDSPSVASGSFAKRWLERVTNVVDTNIKDFANEVTLHYFANAEGDLQLTDDKTDTTSTTAYGRTATGKAEAPLIRTDATALLFLTLYLDLSAYMTFYASCSGRLDAVDLELGDILDLTFTYDDMLNSSVDRIWQVLEISKRIMNGIGRVDYKVVERIH